MNRRWVLRRPQGPEKPRSARQPHHTGPRRRFRRRNQARSSVRRVPSRHSSGVRSSGVRSIRHGSIRHGNIRRDDDIHHGIRHDGNHRDGSRRDALQDEARRRNARNHRHDADVQGKFPRRPMPRTPLLLSFSLCCSFFYLFLSPLFAVTSCKGDSPRITDKKNLNFSPPRISATWRANPPSPLPVISFSRYAHARRAGRGGVLRPFCGTRRL